MESKPQYPFHCLRYVGRKDLNVIIATAGAKIYSISAEDGRKLSTWPPATNPSNGAVQVASDVHGDEPPEKRRKLTPSSNGKDEQGVAHGGSASTAQPLAWSSIPIMVISHSGRYVIALTGEDKHVRVFEIGVDGVLTQLTSRPVPKRPCGISLSFDDSTIFCADKAGDVYALPLLLSEDEIRLVSRTKKHYPPAANTLVVHSKRNLETLRQQLLHHGQARPTTANPTVKRDILLGHVSMLTDLAIASLPSSTSTNNSQLFILTSDRDEQIRVSRGPPQTHVIESYCLGHEAFVSKLCIPASLPQILISGGGDDYLFVWDWRTGQVLHKIPIASDRNQGKIVVRGIWAFSIDGSSSVAVLVALDGSPELLSFLLLQDGSLLPQKSFETSGNVLDVTWAEDKSTLFISVDTCHEPGSIETWKKEFKGNQSLLETYTIKFQDEMLTFNPASSQILENIKAEGTEDVYAVVDESCRLKAQKSLSGVLYNLQNLRKR
ncbi:putative tRNA methyltransferase, partial [Talaromyces proteolyticus]